MLRKTSYMKTVSNNLMIRNLKGSIPFPVERFLTQASAHFMLLYITRLSPHALSCQCLRIRIDHNLISDLIIVFITRGIQSIKRHTPNSSGRSLHRENLPGLCLPLPVKNQAGRTSGRNRNCEIHFSICCLDAKRKGISCHCSNLHTITSRFPTVRLYLHFLFPACLFHILSTLSVYCQPSTPYISTLSLLIRKTSSKVSFSYSSPSSTFTAICAAVFPILIGD